MNLREQFGNIDIYLFDQLLKGHFEEGQRILDVGCGNGRNLAFLLKHDFEVYGVDRNPKSIATIQGLSQVLNPKNAVTNFVVGEVDHLNFETAFFDRVICNAVLHFATDEQHFERMLMEVWRVLKPEGHLFVRLASDIGIEEKVSPLGDRRFLLPDGSVRFLVNEALLLSYTQKLSGELTEYIKTTNVQGLRCMTTWCLRKTI